MKRVAIIIPRLVQAGPVIVIAALVNRLYKRNDITIEIFYLNRKVDPEANILSPIKRFNYRSFRFDKYDVIHTNGIRPDLIAFLNRRKIRYHVSTMHNIIIDDLTYTYNKYISSLFGRIWIKSLKNADKLICVSDFVKEYYKRWFHEERLLTIHNGMPEQNYLLPANDDIVKMTEVFRTRGLKVAGTASILTRRKGIHQVLLSIAETKDMGFIIIGDGKESKDLISISEQLGISDLCYFSGFRSHARRYFKYFDVFVFPSYTEGFGLSLLEAVIAKIPIVCSDIPVFRELYNSDEVTYFRLNDPGSLSEALREAFVQGSNKAELAYKRYNKKYTDHLMAQKHYELYNSV